MSILEGLTLMVDMISGIAAVLFVVSVTVAALYVVINR